MALLSTVSTALKRQKLWTSVHYQKSYRGSCWPTQNRQCAHFRTSLDFDREYLRKISEYQQAVNGVFAHYTSQVQHKKWVNSSTNKKLYGLILTYPKSTVHAFSNNFWPWSYISQERIEISINRKRRFQLQFIPHSYANNLVNLCTQTTKFCCLILNHPSLTLHLLYMYMIMQLHSGHVTLPWMEF